MNLNINFDEVRNVGSQLISKGEEFNSMVNNISNINSQISECWVGSDATKYLSTVEQQISYMKQLSMTISDIGNYLMRVSNNYEEAIRNNMNSIKN